MISYETFNLISLWIGYVACLLLVLLVFGLACAMIHYYATRHVWRLLNEVRMAAWVRRATKHYESIEPMPSATAKGKVK